MRYGIAVVLVLAAIAAAGRDTVHAHGVLRISDPLDGARIGDTPLDLRLTFSERPDPALSDIRIVDTSGVGYQVGRPIALAGDPLSLSIKIRPLPQGVYTVSWQIVSAVDGHTTTGAYAFGVRADPSRVAVASAANASLSLVEVFARWLLIAGLVGLIGGGAAAVARFGGGRELAVAGIGCTLAVAGVLLLGGEQARRAASLTRLLNASVGHSLAWRLGLLIVAGAALMLARRQEPQHRRATMGVALIAALTATAVHAASGHAAAADRWVVATIASQWVHFAAVGIWLGGLAALLRGLRGAPSASKAEVVRRFSLVASFALVVVAATGIVRSVGELSAWGDLMSTAYGRTVLAKVGLTAGIAAFAAVNHWHSVAAASGDLRPLRRAGNGEVMLAGCTLAVAALLGSLAPPAAALRNPSGLVALGVDFGTTVRVKLTTPSDQPGPNRFAVNLADYDSGTPLSPRRVSLRFTPLDDARIAPTTLELKRDADGEFLGSGSNLAFDGRWQITALVERETDSVEVPMEVETRIPPQFVSIERPVGQPRNYVVQVENAGHIAISPDPEQPGPTKVTIICYDVLRDQRPIENIVVTLKAGDGPVRQQPVRRVSPSTFMSTFAFERGSNRITVIAGAPDGTRLRAALTLDIPR